MAEPAERDVVMTDIKPIQPAVENNSSFTNARGQKLFTSTYLPFSGEAKAILLWHIGHGDHIGRYEHVFAFLATSGTAVYCYDCFGHGRSEPKDKDLRCYIPDFNLLVDDYLFRLDQIKEEYTKQGQKVPPIFAGGQSMGGMVVAMAMGRRQSDFAGLILQSPMIDVEWNFMLRIQASMGALLNALFPKAALVPAVRPEDMSQDPKVVKDYIEDKLCYVGNTKCRTAFVCLQAMKSLHKITPTITLPVYICHGSKDRCTSGPASKRFYEEIGSKDKTYNLVEGGYHELLLGPEKADVLKALVSWIDSHISPGAAGSAAAAAAGTSAAAAAAGAGAASTAAVVAQAQAIANQTADVIQDLKKESAAAAADSKAAAAAVTAAVADGKAAAAAAATDAKAAAAGAAKSAADAAKATAAEAGKAVTDAKAAASDAAKK